MPNVVVIAGPNGAGKSTLAPSLITKVFGSIEFVNADIIAAELGSGGTDIQAGKQMHRRLRELSKRKESFAFETTLSARSYSKFLLQLKSLGYSVQIVFLWLPDVELSIERVAERVRRGGHNIADETIRRRYPRGLRNFLKIYLPLTDVWRFYDASGEQPQLVAFGDKIDGEVIVDKDKWQDIRK